MGNTDRLLGAQLDERTLCCARLADGVGEDYRTWTRMQGLSAASRVFIQSPAGTGKTAFLAETLFPFALGQGRSVLYLGSRASCREMAALSRAQGLAERSVPGAAVFSHANGAALAVAEYEAFMSLEKKNLPPLWYVVLDEAHLFWENCLSDPRTGLLLERLADRYRDAAMLFLSASMCASAPVLAAALERWQRQASRSLPMTAQTPLLYRNVYAAGRCRVQFFAQPDELCAPLRQTPEEEKWLFWAVSRQMGEKLRRSLRAQGIEATLLTAEKRGSALWRALEQGQCGARVLIAAGLGEDVRLRDGALRHLVLPFGSGEQLRAWLSRCPLQAGETLSVYLALPSVQTLNARLLQVSEQKSAVERVLAAAQTHYYAAPSAAEQTRLLQELWLAGRAHINALFSIGEDRSLVPNPLAYERLCRLHALYTQLREQCADPEVYPRYALPWLEGAGGEVQRVQDGSLEEFLRQQLGQRVEAEQQEAFYLAFQQRFKAHCYALCAGDEARLRELMGIRKGKTQRKASMNRGLAALSLPYQIKKEQNAWVVRQS